MPSYHMVNPTPLTGEQVSVNSCHVGLNPDTLWKTVSSPPSEEVVRVYPHQEDVFHQCPAFLADDSMDSKSNLHPVNASNVYGLDVSYSNCPAAAVCSQYDDDLDHALSDDTLLSMIATDELSPAPAGPLASKSSEHVSSTYTTTLALLKNKQMIRDFWPDPSTSAQKDFPDFVNLYNNIKAQACPNYLGAKIPLETALNIHAWYDLLKDYHDSELCDFLKYGWPLGYLRDTPPTSAPGNHPSAVAHMQHVHKFISEELRHKALVGPFAADPFTPWVRYSPIMTRPKRESDNRRIIVDLSYPQGYAVNDGIDTHNHLGKDITYSLPTIADLVTRLQSQGQAAFLWKADLTRAYRQLRADPLDAPLLGIKVGDDIYLDRCPPFGCKSSAAICQRVANAVLYILAQKSCYALAYLDDYGGCDTTLKQATDSYNTFKDVCKTLGLQLAEQKCSPPATKMEWLGYQVDSVKMSVAIPANKLEQILHECQLWIPRTKVNKKMIQVLAGKLVYISQCVRSARKFIARILATLRSMQQKEWITIGPTFKADIRWFLHFAELSNGVYLYNNNRHVYEIECDSSLLGGGGNTNAYCYAWRYSQQHTTNYPLIVHLEAINILVAYKTLAPTFTTTPAKILIWTDNITSSYALQSGKTKDDTLAACARELWLQATINNHEIEIKHKKGELIPLADALSRYQDPAKARTADSLIALWHLHRLKPVTKDYKFFDDTL